MKTTAFCWTCLILALSMTARSATLSIFAGGGTKPFGPATECRLYHPFATDFDAAGNIYICEMTTNRVLKVDARGNLALFAGTGGKGSGGDGGPATHAQFNGPHHLLVMKNGEVLVADTWNWKIRRIDAK